MSALVCVRINVRAFVRACVPHNTRPPCEPRNRNELINKLLPKFVRCFVIFPWFFDSSEFPLSLSSPMAMPACLPPHTHSITRLYKRKLCCRCALHAACVLRHRARVAADKWIINGLQSCELLFNVTIFSRNASLWNHYYSTEEEKNEKSSCTWKTFTYFFLFISLVKIVYEWLQAIHVRDIAAKLVNTSFIQRVFFYLAADTSVVCSMFIFMKCSFRYIFFHKFHNAFENPNHRMKIKDENVFITIQIVYYGNYNGICCYNYRRDNDEHNSEKLSMAAIFATSAARAQSQFRTKWNCKTRYLLVISIDTVATIMNVHRRSVARFPFIRVCEDRTIFSWFISSFEFSLIVT